MTAETFRTFGLVTVYTVALTFLLLGIDRLIQPSPGLVVHVSEGTKCASDFREKTEFRSCLDGSALTRTPLPDQSLKPDNDTLSPIHYRFVVTGPLAPGHLKAVYFPKTTHLIDIVLNNQVVVSLPSFDSASDAPWPRPDLFPLPPDAWQPEINTFDILVADNAKGETTLAPFMVGDLEALVRERRTRIWITSTLGQLSFVLMVIIAMSAAGLRMARGDRTFNWLIVAALSGTLFTARFAFPDTPLPALEWAKLSDIAQRVFGVTCAIFFLRMVKVRNNLFERSYLGYSFITILIIIIAPAAHFQVLSDIMNFGLLLPAMIFMGLFWMNKHALGHANNQIVLFFFSLIVATGPAIYWSSDSNTVSLVIQQLVPLLMVAIAFWIILGQVIASITAYEQLNKTLEHRIAEKSNELSATYAELAESRRAEAVIKERERIMMELHDGVGGHLVNALAYLRAGGDDRKVLQASLEDGLSDLSLAVDSLTDVESVATLLGMLRTRLEPLLAANGIAFRWNVEDDPQVPHDGASRNIHILRIIQEAVTNVIKHANASEIEIRTTSFSICVCDNGRGITAARERLKPDASSGYGISTMAQRARELGARLDVQDRKAGCCVTLSWKRTEEDSIRPQKDEV
ncbi:MAG: ATP-binding protein [Pseudomonadota bacterium]